MSFDQLVKRLKPTFLEAASQYPSQPFRLFLAASDMKVRAITRHASGATAADAWDSAVRQLKAALGSINPTILRADWIRDAKPMTWQDFLGLIGKTRRNYFRKGIALDPDFKIAFTECELNGNSMIYKDGKAGGKYCVFRPDRSDEYCRQRFDCDFPKLNAGDPVVVFETVGAFVSDEEKTPLLITGTGLHAGHRDVSNIDDATFLRMARSGASYLAGEVKPNGRFIYGHYPCTGRIVPSYNTLRHFSSIFAMLDVYETYGKMGNSKLGAAINKALKYGLKTFIQYRTLEDGSEAAYPVDFDGNEIKLGALGVTLVMLVKHSILMKTKKNLPLMEALARGIYSMQQPDGSFVHVLHSEDYSVKEPFRIVYYDGEAIFGLMRLYSITRDEKLRATSEAAFKRFIATNHWENHDHWLSYAVNELTTYQPKREYFEFGINNFLNFLPFVYHRDTQFPTLMELMMAADTMLERMKKMPEMADLLARVPLDDFYAAMESRAKNLLNGFFYPELAMFFKIPGIINGAFFIRHQAFRVRTDDVEHFLSGFVAYRRYLAHRDHDPIPSAELLSSRAEGTGLINRRMSDVPIETVKPVEPIQNEPVKPVEPIPIVEPAKPIPIVETVEPKSNEELGAEVKQFVDEFNRRNGMMFFMLRNIKAKAAGIEFAAFRRAQLFKEYFGCEACLLTHEYQNDLLDRRDDYGLDNPVLNMYDHFQEIDRQSTPSSFAQLPTFDADCRVEYVESNIKVTRNGRLVMYCVFDPDSQKLSFINFFDNGKKNRRDTFDILGFLSRRQTLDPATSQPLETICYRPDGSVAIKEHYEIVDGKSVLKSFEVIDREGQTVHAFNSHEEAMAQWVFDLVNNDRHTYFLIGDRTPEYTDAYIKLKSEGAFNDNVFVLHQIHNIHFNMSDGATRTRHQYLLTDKLKTDAILTLTNQQRADIIERHHPSNVMTIPHALTHVKTAKRTNFDRFRVVQVGRFVPEKGQLKSIEAFKRVLEKIPQATLHFYGSGGLQMEMQARIDDAGLGRSIIIEGFSNDIPSVFANAALSIFPSTFEGFGLAVQESLQNGCPVVAFDCKYGPSDQIDDGVNGFIVAVNDIEALTDRIVKVLSDPELQQTLSSNAARSVEKFSPSNTAGRWAEIFLSLMQRGDER